MINKEKNKALQLTINKGVYEALEECCNMMSKGKDKRITKSDLIEHLIIDYFRAIVCSMNNKKDVSATSTKKEN